MKNLIHFLGGAVVGACLILAFSPAHSAEQPECFPIASLKVSFKVVFPNATQSMLHGNAARAYLDEYNNHGRPTDFSGDTLFLTTLPNGTTMIVPLDENGIGCHRMIVGPKLHKVIMAKVGRGAV